MAIIEFECVANTRLALRGITSVKMNPAQKLQMILGTNGSGKSTIMSELSPLAAKHANYERGVGYKRTVHDYKGHIYECLSDFRSEKNHFSVKRDGEVLYEGHSSEAYQAKVAQEFKMTPDLHDIRTGKKRLTTMSVEERRKWFTKISPQDYSYAIGYYKKLADATRDISGTIKRLNTKLMQEKAKLISDDDEKAIRDEITSLKSQKSEMMQHWRPMGDSVDYLLSQVNDIDVKLETMVNEFTQSLRVYCNASGFKDTQDVWKLISDKQARLLYVEKTINDICEGIESNRELLDQAKEAMGQDLDTINKELAEVSRQLIQASLVVFSDDWKTNYTEALTAYDAVYGNVMEILEELPDDEELIYTPEEHLKRQEAMSKANSEIEGLIKVSLELSEKISIMEHKRDEGHTECPKCSHVWSRGFDEDVYHHLKTQHQEVSSKLEKIRQLYSDMEEVQHISARANSLINALSMLARTNPTLHPMWTEINKGKLLRRLPKKALEYVKAVRWQIEATRTYCELKQKQEELTKAKQSATELSGVNQRELLDKNTQLESQLVLLQTEVRDLNSYIQGLNKVVKAMEYQERYTTSAEDLLMKRGDLIHKAEVANHHEAINAIMMQLDSDILQKERLIAQIDTQQALIKALEDEVSECTKKEAMMTKAMQALSPKTGLIAKGLTGFINHFIAQMNAVIEKVWLYPLEILPITITEEDGVTLNYDFSFKVDGIKAGKDVKDGSGAMTEIFDIAFMLVSMVHLGMDDGEIFLDEFSIKMDYAHRKEAMKMIMDLLTTSNFSQIFMISHYESSYGAMSNADITVLCSENIQLPSDLSYNQRSTVDR